MGEVVGFVVSHVKAIDSNSRSGCAVEAVGEAETVKRLSALVRHNTSNIDGRASYSATGGGNRGQLDFGSCGDLGDAECVEHCEYSTANIFDSEVFCIGRQFDTGLGISGADGDGAAKCSEARSLVVGGRYHYLYGLVTRVTCVIEAQIGIGRKSEFGRDAPLVEVPFSFIVDNLVTAEHEELTAFVCGTILGKVSINTG